MANLGPLAEELYHLGDAPRQFYMLASMGLASSIGLGIALATERRTLVFDGDGSILMNLGSLATIAAVRPQGFVHVVFDNQCYSSTGGQPTATAAGVSLAGIAAAAGLRALVFDADSPETAVAAALSADAPTFVLVPTAATAGRPGPIPLDPPQLGERFAAYLRSSTSAPTASHHSPNGAPPPSTSAATEAPSPAARALDELLAAGADFFVSLPCGSLAPLLTAIDASGAVHVRVTREEEGVGVCAGARLAGRKPVLLLQNSGLGNSVNALVSLAGQYGLAMLLLVAQRGGAGEQIRAQLPMGEATTGLLDVAGISHASFATPNDLSQLGATARAAFAGDRPVSALIVPGAWR